MKKLDKSISILWANVISITFALPIFIIPTAVFAAVWGGNRVDAGLDAIFANVFAFLGLFIGGIVLHEALHGLTWQTLSNQRSGVVEYGVKWMLLTPYTHMKARISVRAYRLGTLMPGLVLGIIPLVVAMATGNGFLLWYGLIFTWAAGGDAIILWLLRDVPGDWLVEDHPSRAGCYVLMPLDESLQEAPL